LHEVLSPLTWRDGRITLLGDSVSLFSSFLPPDVVSGGSDHFRTPFTQAHASLPHNGAGAGQAIEDAYVLRALLTHPSCDASNVEQFLQAYEDVRIPRTSAQQLDAIETGEVGVWAVGSQGGVFETTMG
jgi:salicylate hydroxylase